MALPLDDLPLSDGVIVLRRGTGDDAAAVVERISAAPDIAQWTLVPAEYTAQHWHDWLRTSRATVEAGTDLPLLIEDAGGDLLGAIGLHRIRADIGEIGYWLAPQARGQGVATRAVRLLTRWAHERLGLREIEILVHVDNAASLAVPARAGYADTGRRVGAPVRELPAGDYARFVYPPPREER